MSKDALATFFKENWRKGSPFTVKTPFIYLGGSLRKLIQVAAAMSAYQNIIIELGGCDPLGIEVIIEYITKNAYKNKNTVIVFDPYHDENIDFKLKFKPK